MRTQPVSEKAAEILFNRFMMQSFPLGDVQLFAPSSVEEFKSGYDTKVIGGTSLREIYLQFKAPSYSNSGRFTAKITKHQHATLQQIYPSRSAYYVAPMFRTLQEFNDAQASVRIALDFLKHFVCVELSALPSQVDFLNFTKPSSHRDSPQVTYKTPQDGQVRIAKQPLVGDAWCRGSTLFKKFRDGDIGTRVGPVQGEAVYVGPTPTGAFQIKDALASAELFSRNDFGVLLRIPA